MCNKVFGSTLFRNLQQLAPLVWVPWQMARSFAYEVFFSYSMQQPCLLAGVPGVPFLDDALNDRQNRPFVHTLAVVQTSQGAPYKQP